MYHVYAIDTRGYGKTPRREKPFTIRQFAEDLLGFMDEHQIGKAHLLGFSDGGNIAMVFAVRYPGRVGRLILNGANLNAAGVKRRVQIPIEIGYWIAGAELCFIEGDHFIANKKAEAFNARVLEFLAEDTPEIQ